MHVGYRNGAEMRTSNLSGGERDNIQVKRGRDGRITRQRIERVKKDIHSVLRFGFLFYTLTLAQPVLHLSSTHPSQGLWQLLAS